MTRITTKSADQRFPIRNLREAAVTVAVLLAAAYLGRSASWIWLILPLSAIIGVILLNHPQWGLALLVVAALMVPIGFGTGTEVQLNLAALLVPVLVLVWVVLFLRRRVPVPATSRAIPPLLLFVGANLLSLVIGNAIWDPAVPRSDHFLLVQLAQVALYAFSAAAFWLSGNLLADEVWLRRVMVTFMIIGGTVALVRAVPGGYVIVGNPVTIATIFPTFWLLLAALAGGQILFNDRLAPQWRGALLLVLGAVLYYAFVLDRSTVATWVTVAAVLAVLVWLRWPRLRWFLLVVALLLVVTGILFPAVYVFAGGDAEWQLSGGSRLALIQRVLELAMRNPITGLGPAAYRAYGLVQSLAYEHVYWTSVRLSSHNNYVDVFAQDGAVGLLLFVWFMSELGLLGWRMTKYYKTGFAAGYACSMFATWAGVLVVMMFADWFLPFVYNVGFHGFQASVPVWMFMGGLVALEQVARQDDAAAARDAA